MVQYESIGSDFVEVAAVAGISIAPSEIEVEFIAAPHRRPSSLPTGKSAVYAFMLADRCLKVGKAGPKSAALFCSQHYGSNRAPSSLARSLVKHQTAIDISGLDETNVADWICQYTCRVHFFIPSKYGIFALSLLEAFVQCRLRPQFEGFASQCANPDFSCKT